MSPKIARESDALLTPGEHELLANMYHVLGAWTWAEAADELGEERLLDLCRMRVLGRQDSAIGPVLQLLSLGRQIVLGEAGEAFSFARQLDRAYLRLCMTELGWEEVDEVSPFQKDLSRFAPNRNFMEVRTRDGSVLLGGKLTDGGYSRSAIKDIGRKLQSSALAHHFRLIILTPSAVRGRKAAGEYAHFMELRTHLPGENSQKNGNFSSSFQRFRMVVREAHSKLEAGPFLTPDMTQIMQVRQLSIPKLSLAALLSPRHVRVSLALQALDCDGVLTHQQLHFHYGLQLCDLPGRWMTATIVRPQAKADALEVPTHILIASKRMRQLGDARLLHLVNLAELRQLAGIPPDPQRWLVNPKSHLPSEEPDAVFWNAEGEGGAAESDIGHYRYGTVADKLETFRDRGFTDVIYGVPSRVRLRRVQQHFGDGRGFQAFQTHWWTEW